MALLVVLAGGVHLDRPLQLLIKRELAARASMNHVPGVIADVAELPTTFSGKFSEAAARDAANRAPVRNLAAIRNPASLEAIRRHPALTPPGS
jgi:acetoacetyl-CoA synthetase